MGVPAAGAAADKGCTMIREKFSGDLKEAIRAKDSHRISTLRLICAAVKDRDIASQNGDNADGCSEAEILAILVKMIKQRQESATAYEEAGRLDLAAQERAEVRILEDYLPRQMSDTEVKEAIATAIEDCGACSIRDMGKVMAKLKARHPGKMDFTRAGAALKETFR
jgi:uncharacterized protein